MLDLRYLGLGLVVYPLLRGVAVTVYNIYFHPLAKFPGPTFAASSKWYKTYHEVFLQESWTTLLRELHEKYGLALPLLTLPTDVVLNRRRPYCACRPQRGNTTRLYSL